MEFLIKQNYQMKVYFKKQVKLICKSYKDNKKKLNKLVQITIYK